VILPDVNVLIYAFRREAVDHMRYADWLADTVATCELALVDTVLTGFVRIVTSGRIMADPAPAPIALRFIDALRAAPRARALIPTTASWQRLRAITERDSQVRGPLIPDAWLASLALSQGCRLATADRGFARFDGLDWFMPVPPIPPHLR
jgi:toxin-antitoxin system PIN domain toxin